MADEGKSEDRREGAREMCIAKEMSVAKAPAVGDTHKHHVSFLDVVAFEQRRSQRHNHYFVVAFIGPKQVALRELARTAAKSLRASDLLGPVGMDGRFHWDCPFDGRKALGSQWPEWAEHGVLGIILPETDRSGAEVALRRIAGQFGDDHRLLLPGRLVGQRSCQRRLAVRTAAD